MQKGNKLRKKIWFKCANVSLNMPSCSNRLTSCSALNTVGRLFRKRVRKELSPRGNASRDAENFRNQDRMRSET